MMSPVERLYYALLLWADRAFRVIDPEIIFVATLGLIAVGMEVGQSGWRKKRTWQTMVGLLVTSSALAWSTVGFLTIRSGGGGVSPKEIAFLPFSFAFSGLTAGATLCGQLLQHVRLLQSKSRGERPSS